MKKLSLIVALLICGTSVFAATSTMSSDSDMMGPGKAYCENNHMSSKDCKAEMDKWKNATPDQKMAMMKEHWSKMTPDQRQMAMNRMVMKFKSMDADSQKSMMKMMKDSMDNN
jgi:hypothetical protein